MKRIVLTGGPGAGKTAVSAALAARRPDRYAQVPEAATAVYDALRTRWDLLDDPGRRDVQRRIYQLQLDQEAAAAIAHPTKALLLDRGTVDGSGYWPEGPNAYWRELQTTAAAELARYDAVIWLETCAAVPGLYDGGASNPRRFEAADAAIASGQTMRSLWSSHPRCFEVSACAELSGKIDRVETILNTLYRH